MTSATQAAQVCREKESYDASILSDTTELTRLQATAGHSLLLADLLATRGSAFQPEFFLATLSKSRWTPRIVVVRDGETVAGLLYAKERKFAGLNTGLIYADSTLGTMIIADAADQTMVLQTAFRALLKTTSVRGLRLLVPPDGFELPALRELQQSLSLDIHDMPVENHSVLPLSPTYELFLEKLSAKTRRSFRRFRNRSEAANHQFVRVPLADFEAAAWALMAEDVVGANREGIERGMNVFQTAERPLLVGLRAESGEWLSILGGWYESDHRVVIFLQMNSDRKHARYSLSLVMRAHLIEWLIAQGIREMVWWAGVGAPIRRYVTPVPSRWVYLDKRNFVWRAFRRLLDAQRGRLPRKILPITEWIVAPRVSGANSSSSQDE